MTVNPHTSSPIAAHQGQGIAVLDDTGAHPVVEMHLAVHELVLEVDVDGPRRQDVGDPGQREVVGGNQADRAAIDQAADDRLRPDRAIVRVRPVEQLVE